jgi:hypothetical protein
MERDWLSLKSHCSMDMRYQRLEYDHKDVFDVYPVLPYEGELRTMAAHRLHCDHRRKEAIVNRAINHALK